MNIKFEKVKTNIKGRKYIINTLPWINNSSSFKLDKEEDKIVNIMKKVWLEESDIKVIAPDGYYLKVPSLKGTYSTSMYNDNIQDKELLIYSNKPTELYISFNSAEKVKYKNHNIYNCFVIDVISNNELEIYRYFIFIFLHYKDNGKIANPNGGIDIEIVPWEIFRKEVAYEVVDFVALGYFLWLIIMLILSLLKCICILDIIKEPMIYVILVSYIVYVGIRSKYVGNTWLNKLWKFFIRITKKRPKDYYSMKDVYREIEKMKQL